MKLYLSFTGLYRFWKAGEVDFAKDMFFFGCGRPHVFDEPGLEREGKHKEAQPWSEWLQWHKVSKEDCLKVQALLLKAHEEGRVGFAQDYRQGEANGSNGCHGPIGEMLRKQGIETPPEPDDYNHSCSYGHNYCEVRDWLKGTIECPF